MSEFENQYIQSWGFDHVQAIPDFMKSQLEFLRLVSDKNLKTGDIFVKEGLLDEKRKNRLLEQHDNLPVAQRRQFARWVFDQTPNDKLIQDAKNRVMALVLRLPYVSTMPNLRSLSLAPVTELSDAEFREECKKKLCIPCFYKEFESSDEGSLYLVFGNEQKLREYTQAGPQQKSLIKELESKYGEANSYCLLTEEDTVIAELGSSSVVANSDVGSKILLERDLLQHEIARHWVTIFNEAIKLGGTDIHCDPSILPNDDSVSIKIRIDGKLVDVTKLKSAARLQFVHSTFSEMVSFLHSETGAGEVGRTINKPVSGMVFDYENHSGVMRIKMRPEFSPLGIKDAAGKEIVRVVLRVWEIKDSIATLRDLNVPGNVVSLIDKLIKADDGLILAAGPTGSGKSTLIGAILDAQHEYDGGTESILSFEDPIEQVSKGLVQAQLTDSMRAMIDRGEVDELTARQTMLRSFLRQDPDKVFIGEVRDSMTAMFAGDIASSGHKTFATFHATSPEDALVRLAAKLEGSTANLVQFFSALTCIINTKLVPSNCPSCKLEKIISEAQLADLTEKYHLNDEQQKNIKDSAFISNSGKDNDGNVCRACSGKGTKGRVPVFGVFKLSRTQKMVLMDFNDSTRFMKVTEKPDIDMRDSIVDLLAKGVVSVDTLLGGNNDCD